MVTLNYLQTNIPKKIDKLVIFIHGYGASGNDLINLAPYFKQCFKDYWYIAPNAPNETNIMSNSYFWFPIDGFDEKHLQEGLDNSIPILDKFIAAICKKHKLQYNQIILCGFSQGTLLALHYGLGLKKPINGIIGFSGGALLNIKDNIKNSTPICLIHGDNDQVLPSYYSTRTAEILKEKKHDVKLKIINHLEHSINQEGLEFAINFLKQNS